MVGYHTRVAIRRLIAAAAVLLALSWTPAGAAAGGCQYVLGFKILHDALPETIGDCRDNQASAANGDAIQHSLNGLLAWRRADNWTAFSDGYRTWVSGPNGIQQRLNSERFTWEHDVLPFNGYLVALGDGGKGGLPAGCGDSLVAVARTSPYRSDAVAAAIEDLLAIRDKYYGQSGLYDPLWNASLTLDSVRGDGAHGLIRLNGSVAPANRCDALRIQSQLTQTVMQFGGVSDVTFTVNGTPLTNVLGLSTSGGKSEWPG